MAISRNFSFLILFSIFVFFLEFQNVTTDRDVSVGINKLPSNGMRRTQVMEDECGESDHVPAPNQAEYSCETVQQQQQQRPTGLNASYST